ncbi:hypothetical protein WJX74_008468 [Apatococcus lobatus]|uniref:Hpc2-related domain-containing protein n=1 Tax=Apatococcus lobatus TaxID=904363 RepID=A0AAW1SHB3_9CHLO
MKQARRITPELVSPSQLQAIQPAFAAAQTQLQRPEQSLTLKEHAAFARAHLPAGRRLYVDLTQRCDFDFKKLLKEAKAVQKSEDAPPTVVAQPAAAPAGLPAQESHKPAGGDAYSSVVQRLQRLYMMGAGDNSDSEQEVSADEGNDDAASDGEDGEQGKRETYDNDDEFIDDSEYVEYFSGDRHKPKFDGFFINRGPIEKSDVRVDGVAGTPRKKKRRVAPEQLADGEAAQAPKRIKAAKLTPQNTKRPANLKAVQHSDKAKAKKTDGSAPAKKTDGSAPAKKKRNIQPDAVHPAPKSSATISSQANLPHTLQPQAQAQSSAAAAVPSMSLAALAAAAGASANNDLPTQQPTTVQQAAAPADVPSLASLPVPKMTAGPRSTGAAVSQPPLQPVQPPESQESGHTAEEAAASLLGISRSPPGQHSLPHHSTPEAGQIYSPAATPATPNAAPVKHEAFSAELEGRLAALQAAAIASPAREPKQDSKKQKAIPKQLKEKLPALSCTLNREVDAMSEEDGRALKKAVIDHLMSFMEIFTSRSNLTARLSSLWTDIQAQLNMTKQELQSHIKRQLAEGDAALRQSPTDPEPGAPLPDTKPLDKFLMSRNVQGLLATWVQLVLQVRGRSLQNYGLELATAVAAWFPAELGMDPASIVPVLSQVKRHKLPPKMRQATLKQEKPAASSQVTLASASSGPTEPPAEINPSAAAPIPTASGPAASEQALPSAPAAEPAGQEEMAAAAAAAAAPPEPLPQPVSAPTGPSSNETSKAAALPSASSGGPNISGASSQLLPTAPSVEQCMEAAGLKGADRAVLENTQTRLRRNSTRDIVSRVLMFAGPEGLSVRDLIHQAAALQVAAWDWTRSRQTNVSNVIAAEPNFVHVGGSKYAHKAFPGVVEKPKQKGPHASAGAKTGAVLAVTVSPDNLASAPTNAAVTGQEEDIESEGPSQQPEQSSDAP